MSAGDKKRNERSFRPHDKKRATMAAHLATKTGRDLDGWVALLRAAPVSGYTEQVSWLKSEHGLGHFQARMVASALRDA